MHQNKTPFKCNDCESSFCNKYNLKAHVERKHLKISFKKLSCTDCDAKFERKWHLELHMNTVHLNTKPYNCESCDKSFSIKAYLKHHVSIVHSEKLKNEKSTQMEQNENSELSN